MSSGWSFFKRAGWWLGLISFVSLAGYLITSQAVYRWGYPLDDAWIHQAYARTLGQTGQFAFFPGQPSAGSTSPLWSFLLAPAYALGIPAYLWTMGLGWLSLWALGCAGQYLFETLQGKEARWPWAGGVLVLEWHMVWASGSGMETALYAAAVVYSLGAILSARDHRWRWLLLGASLGLLLWLRPDALTLLGPAGLAWLVLWRCDHHSWKKIVWLAAGFAPLIGLYLLFNWTLQGTVWPNTFYAKQAEYAALQTDPWLGRFASLLGLPLVGVGLLLAPGVLFGLWQTVRNAQWAKLGLYVWYLGYAGIYAWKLPVTYQYGRYLMPAMPVFFVLGLSGWVKLWQDWSASDRTRNLAKAGAVCLLAGVLGGFYVVGASIYARDVAIIETEMVDTARWVAQNTPPDAVVAVHDIGAMGIYSQRKLVDLAGLISPEVVPFIREEAALADFLDQKNVSYLVAFPGWYPQLVQRAEPVYHGNGRYAQQAGGEALTVYRWK